MAISTTLDNMGRTVMHWVDEMGAAAIFLGRPFLTDSPPLSFSKNAGNVNK